jgi:hypothetical protein
MVIVLLHEIKAEGDTVTLIGVGCVIEIPVVVAIQPLASVTVAE